MMLANERPQGTVCNAALSDVHTGSPWIYFRDVYSIEINYNLKAKANQGWILMLSQPKNRFYSYKVLEKQANRKKK